MIMRMIGFFLAVFLLSLSILILYDNMPHDPVDLVVNSVDRGEHTSYIDYGTTPVFSKNLRFDHTNITYYIEYNCPNKRRRKMIKAFEIFEEKMDIIKFIQIDEPSNADILVGCSDDYISVGEDLFAAGEGGPSEIINTSIFKVIKKGKISLYKETGCDYPVVEIHELSHVFGFDHTPNEKSIMHNVSRCDQRITPDMVTIIQELYSIEPKADLRISNVSSIKKGKYLDFNITVLNEGLKLAKNVNISIISKGEEIEITPLGDIDIGFGRTLKAQNIMLNSRSVDEIEFIVDKNSAIEELNKKNNHVSMKVTETK